MLTPYFPYPTKKRKILTKYKKYKKPIRQYQSAKFNPESILFSVIYCNA